MAADPGVLDQLTTSSAAPHSDARLVHDLMEGSQDALAHLYDRHSDLVFAVAMRATRDREIAAEVVQDTFMVLWNRAELYDASRGALATWLSTIARNRATDRLRSAGRHDRASTFSSFARGAEVDEPTVAEWLTSSGALIGAARPEPAPEVALSTAETRASIERALATLGPAERMVIDLAYDAGLSQSEIAERLGWPIGTVKTRTRRGLRHLRDELERSEPTVRRTQDASTTIPAVSGRQSNHGVPRAAQGPGSDWGTVVASAGLAPTAATCCG